MSVMSHKVGGKRRKLLNTKPSIPPPSSLGMISVRWRCSNMYMLSCILFLLLFTSGDIIIVIIMRNVQGVAPLCHALLSVFSCTDSCAPDASWDRVIIVTPAFQMQTLNTRPHGPPTRHSFLIHFCLGAESLKRHSYRAFRVFVLKHFVNALFGAPGEGAGVISL